MELNLSAILGNLALKEEPQESSQRATTSLLEPNIAAVQSDTPAAVIRLDMSQIQAPTGAEQAPLLSTQYQREQQELDRAREVYRSYQDNIRAAGNMRADILKGVKAGEPAELLLLQACKIISAMTGDRLFSDQIERDLIAVYGYGQQAAGALQMELEQVQQRLHNMQQALERELEPDCRQRIQRAIAAHKEKENSLQSLIEGK